MKKTIVSITLVAFALATGFAEDPADSSKKEKKGKKGFVSLFDGKTLEGWKSSTLGSAKYSVVDGAIHGETVEGSPNTFLLSEKQYGDFILEFEVKVHDSLNSGCQIRSREKTEADLATTGKDGKPAKDLNRFFGPQVELEASPGQAGYIYGEATGRGWLSPEPQEKDHAHSYMKNGEWNKIRIVAKGARIQTFINGNAVADLSDEVIYKSHPKGHIGLQVHGIKKGTGPFDVSWKDIKLKEFK
ncbi:MAG: DUF1080 domain-containing protein [Verrucomicrobiales bacterium]|nr:DUF1080 domain-containing protein [Verrucomicrobiales bacterium]